MVVEIGSGAGMAGAVGRWRWGGVGVAAGDGDQMERRCCCGREVLRWNLSRSTGGDGKVVEVKCRW